MDAKPQRPGRSIRVFGDENAVPGVGPQKTIHHRNKSSPALTSMLHNGASKGLTKRTAFGDVSNTANALRSSKDDSLLSLKPGLKTSDKIGGSQDEKQGGTFLKPAQRPLSISTGLKGLMSNVTGNARQALAKQSLADIQKQIQAVKQPSRAINEIPKANAPIKIHSSNETELRPSRATIAPQAPVPPVHRELPPLPDSVALKEPAEAKIREADGKQLVEDAAIPVTQTQPELTKVSKKEPISSSDGLYIDQAGGIQVYEFQDAVEVHEPASVGLAPIAMPPPREPLLISTHQPKQAVGDNFAKVAVDQPTKLMLPPVSEPEEYWDDEIDENYEEDGYVTARSFKSRADTTTGNATTVLFPKMTQKVRKEIAAAKELIENSKTIEELEDEAWDTTMVAEYGDEIFSYMREQEIKMLPNPHYMDNQAEIQWSMRGVLMDWIVQVHHRFNLLPETLFLTTNYIDRFLSCKVVSLGKLQLVGATAIFIAAKYEEIDCPSVQEIVYMVDNGYSVDEVLKAERFMLSMLQFELGWPGPMSFLRKISKADDYDLETRTLAKYFLEITIMDERFVGSPPSFTAAGAHCLARQMLRKGTWTPAHVYYSNYTYSQLFSLVLLIVECCENARQHHGAVFEKYIDKRYKRASSFVESEMNKGFQILDVSSNNSPHLNNIYGTGMWGQTPCIMGEAC